MSALNVVGARYEPGGRTFDFDAGTLHLQRGDIVVIEERHGTEVVTVSVASARRPAEALRGRVVRKALEADLDRLRDQQQRVAEALAFARERVRARAMPIKVFRAELSTRGDRAMFYFSSEQRVDFRELVRDLADHLHARVELRQVGVRDEAKMVGGIGSCGLELCCNTFLPRFAPVSIRMAKNQNLALNPTKVSGQCGRLKCCLVYEDAMYVEAARNLPRVGKPVETPDGQGRVEDLDVLGGRVRVSFPDRPPVVFGHDELRWSVAPAAEARPSPSAPAADEPPPEAVE